MYTDHFGLRCNPFRLAPSAEFFFAGRSHREALAALQWGLSDPTGLVLLTGDVGTGKTTVVRELLSRDARDVRTALVRNPKLPFDQLLESILRQVGVTASQGRAEMLEALARASEEHRLVVVIDEAQQLSDEALEEFRLLSNTSPEHLQLMLVGQPELLARLNTPQLRQLNQRIAIRAVLNPLEETEMVDYLRHRVRAAGGEATGVFSRRALRAAAQISQGIPRRANILAHNALVSAFSAGQKKVRAKDVFAAARDYDWSGAPSATSIWTTTVWRRSLLPTALLAGVIAFNLLHRRADSGQPVKSSVPLKPSVTALKTESIDVAPTVLVNLKSELSADNRAALPRQDQPAAAIANVAPVSDIRSETRPSQHAQISEPTTDAVPAANTKAADDIVVRAGDTLSSIAQRYSHTAGKIDIQQLVAANPDIKDVNLIYPGEKVHLAPK